jgi:hypothetical protein
LEATPGPDESAFVNREKERAELRELLAQGRPQLALLYGRRRVGKTHLLKHVWPVRTTFHFTAAFPTGHGIGQTIPGLSAVQKTAVANAIDFYRSHYQDWDLLFDRELHTITQQVIAARNNGLPSTGIPDDLRKTLQSVYPIYMKYSWASQKLENQHWIVSNQQLLSRYGPAIQHELERVLQRKFSDGPYQIYVVHEANWPRPSTVPTTPLPVIDSKSFTSRRVKPRSRADVAIAAARGCSL